MHKVIDITDIALSAIKTRLDKRENKKAFLRIGVMGAGCSGYKYIVEFDDIETPNGNDTLLSFDNDLVRVIIDNKSLKFINGSVIDYENNMMGGGFKIINGNEASRCGCGKSFYVK